MTTIPGPCAVDRRADPRRPADRPLRFLRLPARQGEGARDAIAEVAAFAGSLVFYESGPRLGADAGGARARASAIARRRSSREISKRSRRRVTGTLAELAARYADAPPKGEIVIVVGPPGEARGRERRRDRRRAARSDGAPLAVARRGRGRRAARHAPASAPTHARSASSNDAAQTAERGGRRAERLAAWWLRLKGWRILAVRAPHAGRRGRPGRPARPHPRLHRGQGARQRGRRRLGARRISAAPRRRRRRGAGAALHARRRRRPDRRDLHRPAALAAAHDQRLARVTACAPPRLSEAHEPRRRRPDGSAGEHQHRGRFRPSRSCSAARRAGTGSTIIRAEALSWHDGRLWTVAHPVTVQRVAGDHYPLRRARTSSTSAATPTSC